MIIAEQPPFLRIFLLDKLAKILVTWFVQESKTVRPVVKAELESGLTRKLIGQIFTNLFLWNRQTLNAKREKTLTPFTDIHARARFGRAVAILSIFHTRKRRPIRGS